MSSDATYAIRRAGRDSFFAGRWSAPHIAHTLLRGPEHIDEYLGHLDPRREPDMSICLCGAVFIDFDRRALLFWTYDLFGSGPLRRDFLWLLTKRWPQWRLRQAALPLQEFAAALGRTPPELEQARADATLLDAHDDLFTAAWLEHQADFACVADDQAAWIAAEGVEAVRAFAERGLDAWVTVRAADGALYDQRCNSGALGSLLRLGPRLAALAQFGGPRPAMLRPGLERDVRETLFIDEARRSVHWWQADPPWAHPAPGCAALWPGWTLELDEGGLRSHVERSGRSFAAIRLTRDERLAALIDQVPRTLRGDFAPLPRLTGASALVTTHPELPADVLASLVALAERTDD
ncbi:hypothetical protein [Nannocystis punicea]|uniref:Uncharacterized protein n=1 Tax=Nannocystis punicea TaxID=2995304 RepID=A0ABY7H6M1_9BACT|nr:hypothetical protein [Nannocystis poenicansa]WAS94920.1 hypothetical protein O0S08_02055 [Nannocystis poenicansa]